MTGIVFIIIAIIGFLMRSLITPSKNEPTQYFGVGTIKKRIQENCRVCFYIEFCDYTGKVRIGESIPYKSTKRKYYEGDTANIKYYFSKKGVPFVIIDDNDLVSCEVEAKFTAAIMFVGSVSFFVLGIIFLYLHFVF